jgi:DNA-binding response OmpR family regulator
MRNIKLLYAEDEINIRKHHIEYIQSRYDFEIYEADDGEEALSLFKKHQPDIVLTDITMPKMSGLELAKEIRNISKETKIIALTAHSEKEKLLEALKLNMVNYILKPIERKELRESIDTAIETLKISDDSFIYLDEKCYFNFDTREYFRDSQLVSLSSSEQKLLELLCLSANKQLSAFDIFVEVWEDKEYSSDSVRTLVKNLRKKLPKDSLVNIYGGFYKLQI